MNAAQRLRNLIADIDGAENLLDEVIQIAYDDGRYDGRQEGYDDGYDQGYADGESF